ncbi:hypothetical protein, partial [Streptomyces sp. NPDC059552]|uniref:hypothetical protein n=1 Tax=Streptomyces sp. NPDC059552 TaxID=3346862 RepID=UPI003685F78B
HVGPPGLPQAPPPLSGAGAPPRTRPRGGRGRGPPRDGAVFAQEAAGEWSFTAHLVQDRYLVGEAHRPRPRP